jgi:hypothetical protein
MAHLPSEMLDETIVKLKMTVSIVSCAIAAAEHGPITAETAERPEIAYALWQVQENLCDVLLDIEEEVEFNEFDERSAAAARAIAIEDAAELVERFHDSPVVIQPNESFAKTIARAIRQLAKNEEM